MIFYKLFYSNILWDTCPNGDFISALNLPSLFTCVCSLSTCMCYEISCVATRVKKTFVVRKKCTIPGLFTVPAALLPHKGLDLTCEKGDDANPPQCQVYILQQVIWRQIYFKPKRGSFFGKQGSSRYNWLCWIHGQVKWIVYEAKIKENTNINLRNHHICVKYKSLCIEFAKKKCQSRFWFSECIYMFTVANQDFEIPVWFS
jgi:hypothetical protein